MSLMTAQLSLQGLRKIARYMQDEGDKGKGGPVLPEWEKEGSFLFMGDGFHFKDLHSEEWLPFFAMSLGQEGCWRPLASGPGAAGQTMVALHKEPLWVGPGRGCGHTHWASGWQEGGWWVPSTACAMNTSKSLTWKDRIARKEDKKV